MESWVDAHTHLDADSLYAHREEVLSRAEAAGVRTMLLVNSEPSEECFHRTLSCLQLDSQVRRFAAFGVHPHQASLYDDALESRVVEALQSSGVIGFGEVGLDYYYDHSPRDVQVAVLRRQLQLSKQMKLPVIIHCRDAYEQLAGILKEENAEWRGMIHCFTGTPQEAVSLLSLGFFISFSGIVTFRNAEILREAARMVPPDRILIETDAPFLAPVPHRGKTNEPAFVAHTGEFLAQLRGVPVQEFSTAVAGNFETLFFSPK